jgi:Rrf2 family transcriptional regulator, iron-sulfur cluster assembly transcription factor
MIFSKSFGYALRGVLYVSMMSDENRKIRIDEMAARLAVPRHFLGKIMNKVVKKGILNSTKGPHGGFIMNNNTMSTSLLTLIDAIDGLDQFDGCVLRLRKCNPEQPCPLHSTIDSYKKDFLLKFSSTTISNLLKEDKHDFIRSIAAV